MSDNVTVREAARLVGVQPRTLALWIRQGHLHPRLVGRTHLLDPAVVKAWMTVTGKKGRRSHNAMTRPSSPDS